MPIYEYKCPKCGKKFEIFWRSQCVEITGLPADNSGKVGQSHPCPDCGTDSPKVFSTFGFQFSPYLKDIGTDRMMDY